MNILEQIVADKRIEVAARKKELPMEAVRLRAEAAERSVHSFRRALEGSSTGIIAEFKRKSPSKGFIQENARVAAVVPGYEAAGAAAVSVLTDTSYFGGTLADLEEARRLVSLPLLRKDFVVDPYQLCEARIAGADAVLLIASALTPEACASLAEYARGLGLEVLLEIHNETEVGHINPFVDVVGVNNRNLGTFVTDIRCSLELAERIPAYCLKISESGLSKPEDVVRLRQAGYRGFLMGENFMKEADPAAALKRFIEALER